MKIEENFSLLNYNTFHLPVKTRWFMEYDSEEELERILHDEYFQECRTLPIGCGSNLLFINNFDGIVFHSLIKGMEITKETDDAVYLRIGAGELWDDVAAYAVSNNWGGIENLSYIPGETGAAAVQNIGAYGVELKDVIDTVEAYNQLSFEKSSFTKEECLYGYRSSRFKSEIDDPYKDPYIVTYVTIKLTKKPVYTLHYGELKKRFEGQQDISLQEIRDAVIQIRKEKLPDPAEWGNAGSFFMNPTVEPEQYALLKQQYPDIPAYDTEDGKKKLAAGWLIEQCGFKGKTIGKVKVHDKQALVLINLGEADGHAIGDVADDIHTAVKEQFGVLLIPEVKYIQ